MLLQAENGELALDLKVIDSQKILEEVIKGYSITQFAKQKTIKVHPDSEGLQLLSDEALLTRILGNLVKNALEAASTSETITLRAEAKENEIWFSVHNPNSMPQNVQLQVFQRSFSTKGAGRGIGTYSVKLFTERYLEGRAWFQTDDNTGTTFYIALPEVSKPG